MYSNGKFLITTVLVTTLRIFKIFLAVIEESGVLSTLKMFASPNFQSQKLRTFRILRMFFAQIRQCF
jgi:hypothetical protein